MKNRRYGEYCMWATYGVFCTKGPFIELEDVNGNCYGCYCRKHIQYKIEQLRTYGIEF